MNTPSEFLKSTLALLAHMPRQKTSYVVASVLPDDKDGFLFSQTIVFNQPIVAVEAEVAIIAKTSPLISKNDRQALKELVAHCISLRGQVAILQQAANDRSEVSETQQQVKG